MSPPRRHFLARTGLTLAIIGLSACGTIIYAERKRQVDGKIDPTVAILNGVGLLLFLVLPCVIAFAVDFSNGTIYLPGTQKTRRRAEVKEVPYDGDLTHARLDAVWTETYGHDAPFRFGDLARRSSASTASLHSELSRHAIAQVFAG